MFSAAPAAPRVGYSPRRPCLTSRARNYEDKMISKCLAAAAVLAAGLLMSSAAQAVTDTEFKYAEPRTGFLMLGPPDFVPDASDVTYSMSGGGSIRTSSSGQVCFLAPVRLPHRATFRQMRVFYT